MSLSVGVAQLGDSAHSSQAGGYTNPTQILAGSAAAIGTVTPQTIITIPAGQTWSGSISATMTNNATSGTTIEAQINTAGTGVIPSSSVNLLTVMAATVGTVASDTTNSGIISDVVVAAPPGNSVTITLTNSTSTTNRSYANACGVLI